MTEWWVSQAKNWCKICRVWTGGHKSQILKHEGGRAHIENEERGIIDAQKRNKARNAEEKDVKDQLAEIERKALAAMAADAAPPPPQAQFCAGANQFAGGGATDTRDAEKRRIEEVVSAAKKRKTDDPVTLAWTRHVDPTSKTSYYYNTITKASSWVVPEGFVEPTPEPAAARPPDGPSANGSPWTASTDPTSGCQYYYNSVTKESSWTRPANFTVADSATSAPLIASTAARIAEPAAADTSAAPSTSWLHGESSSGTSAVAVGEVSYTSRSKAAEKMREQQLLMKEQREAGQAINLAPPAAPVRASPPTTATPAAAGGPTGNTLWVVCTDPTTGHIYYFNTATKGSTWDAPPDLGVDLSAPPPPPSKKPPPPPDRSTHTSRSSSVGEVGGWEEVKAEDSMWKQNTDREPDSDEEKEVDALTAMKNLTMHRGGNMDEDYERHQKEAFIKDSSSGSGGAGGKLSFRMTGSKKAAGIRKRDDPEEDARCV